MMITIGIEVVEESMRELEKIGGVFCGSRHVLVARYSAILVSVGEHEEVVEFDFAEVSCVVIIVDVVPQFVHVVGVVGGGLTVVVAMVTMGRAQD